MKKIIFWILILCLFMSIAYSENNHLRLLAASEMENGSMQGGVADLFLEIREGSGSVFIDTYPLSKFDTQLSIRFAKDTACKFALIDCSKYDFLYTIRARSNIIGGPSAGAAITIITYAQLKQLDIDKSIAITGTINSGRLIGNVGAVKEKIEGAEKSDIKKVLIPFNEIIHTFDNNSTLDLIEYGNELGIEVVGVSDIEEALFHFTGLDLRKKDIGLKVDEKYSNIMYNISESLCNRSVEIINLIEESELNISESNITNQSYSLGIELLNRSKQAYSTEAFYSSASQCYAANNNLYFTYLLLKNYSDDYYKDRINNLHEAYNLYLENIKESKHNTIPALQTTMIMRQRLDDVYNYLENIEKYNFLSNTNKKISNIDENIFNLDSLNDSNVTLKKNIISRDEMINNVAFAIERLYTVKLWSQFFQLEGEVFEINDQILKESCNDIINDVKTRIQYAQLYLPDGFSVSLEKINELEKEKDYAYCIAKASIIKADVNTFLGSLSLKMDDIKNVVEKKLDKATEIISEEIENGRFPILGYSYYEYAKTLSDIEPTSALIYSEYALELSNIDLYLNRPTLSLREEFIDTELSLNNKIRNTNINILLILILTLIIGIIIGRISVTHYMIKERKKQNKK
jgi:uncharacterized protein